MGHRKMDLKEAVCKRSERETARLGGEARGEVARFAGLCSDGGRGAVSTLLLQQQQQQKPKQQLCCLPH
jgi:hypothetical protein